MAASASHFVVPLLLTALFWYGLYRGVNVFDAFLEGARQGLKTAAAITPALVCLLTAVGMFKASGALEFFTWALAPAARLLGLPPEVLPLALLRPVSGSGAMVLFRDLLQAYGPDSFVGRVASVLQGSTETTFYTIAVYYGATKVTNTRHTLAASLAGDLMGVLMSVVAVRLFFPG